jgi:Methylase involved in ubiquinone/menaquinone biosynthesis
MQQFDNVTELAGEEISSEQLFRLYNRYHWTASHSAGKDVLEVACGSGAGLGYLARTAKSVTAGDYSASILAGARAHYGDRFDIRQFDAQDMPYPDASFDVVVMHEALYYIPDASRFVAECRRVLRPGGIVLLTNANKDLFDFNPSPYSTVYHGAVELTQLFESHGFAVQLFGSTPLEQVSLIQKVTRPIKWIAVRLGLMPKTMRGKRLLKRIIFGAPVLMPAEIQPDMAAVETLAPIPNDRPCLTHKIIYCLATLGDAKS